MHELFDLEMGTKVKFYRYRTARVFNRFFRISRNSELGEKIEDVLSKKAGVDKDNHSVYEVENKNGDKIYVWMEDSEILFGNEIIIESY